MLPCFIYTTQIEYLCTVISETKYLLDVTIWNKAVRWGYLTVKLYSADQEAVATIDQ